MHRVGQNHTFIGIYSVLTVILAGKSPFVRCVYTVLANPMYTWHTCNIDRQGARHICNTTSAQKCCAIGWVLARTLHTGLQGYKLWGVRTMFWCFWPGNIQIHTILATNYWRAATTHCWATARPFFEMLCKVGKFWQGPRTQDCRVIKL